MKHTERVLYWSGRIIVIAAILFISMFAFDSFSPDRTLRQSLPGFLIHLIPSFIMVIVLVIAWKWEMAGGIILTALGLFFSGFLFIKNYHMNHSVLSSLLIVLLISIPFVVAGILFIVHSRTKKKITA